MQESGLYGILICSVTATVNLRMIFSRNAIGCCYSVVKSLPICLSAFCGTEKKSGYIADMFGGNGYKAVIDPAENQPISW